MKLLAEISEATLGLGEPEALGEEYTLRKSARAILLNNEGNMATQYLHTYTFHKLPGGGVDPGESIQDALVREVREEVGCDCVATEPVGIVIEYRNKYQMLHISYGFVCTTEGDIGAPTFEEGELEEGQETLWLPPAEVLTRMQQDTPGKFEGHFILAREKALLEEYLRTQQ